MGGNQKSKLTDFHTFWKLIILVVVAILFEGAILIAAVSEPELDWSTTEFTNPQHERMPVSDVMMEQDLDDLEIQN